MVLKYPCDFHASCSEPRLMLIQVYLHIPSSPFPSFSPHGQGCGPIKDLDPEAAAKRRAARRQEASRRAAVGAAFVPLELEEAEEEDPGEASLGFVRRGSARYISLPSLCPRPLTVPTQWSLWDLVSQGSLSPSSHSISSGSETRVTLTPMEITSSSASLTSLTPGSRGWIMRSV